MLEIVKIVTYVTIGIPHECRRPQVCNCVCNLFLGSLGFMFFVMDLWVAKAPIKRALFFLSSTSEKSVDENHASACGCTVPGGGSKVIKDRVRRVCDI